MAGSAVSTKDYNDALINSGKRNVRVEFLDQSFMPEPDITFEDDWVMGGEVQLNLDGDVSRLASVLLLDPGRRISYDPYGQTNMGIGLTRFARVTYCVQTATGEWVDTPLITGPVTKIARVGHEVTIEIQGKDALACEPNACQRTYSYKPAKQLYEVIREVMGDLGEMRFVFPDGDGPSISQKLSLERWSFAWPRLKKLAARKGFVMYYDGLGRLVLRRRETTGTAAWRFQHGVDVLTEPVLEWDLLELRNTIVMTYHPKTKDGGSDEKRVVVTFNPPHFLAPSRIARNDKPRYLVEFKDTQENKTEATATALATRAIQEYDDIPMSIQLDALMVPHLKEYDILEYQTDFGRIYSWVNSELTWSLDPGSAMTVGANKDALRQRRRKHGKKNHKHRKGHP